MRSRYLPPWCRANSQLNKRRARAANVQVAGGRGAKRVTTGFLSCVAFTPLFSDTSRCSSSRGCDLPWILAALAWLHPYYKLMLQRTVFSLLAV
jgi:hypothetical protein